MLPVNDDPRNPREDRLKAIGIAAAIGAGLLVAAIFVRGFANDRDSTALVIAVLGAVILIVFGLLYLVGWMREVRLDEFDDLNHPEDDDDGRSL